MARKSKPQEDSLELARPIPETPPDTRPISFDDRMVRRPRFLPLSPDEVQVHLDRLNEFIPVPARADEEEAEKAIHESRYIAWLMGMTWQEIAEAEGVSMPLARRSTFKFLMQVSVIEQIQARNAHSMSRAHNEHDDTYFSTLAGMFKEKSWMARSSAMKAFRHTVGMEGTSVVSVNVDNRKQSVSIGGAANTQSFEQAMERVRRRLNEDNNAPASVASNGIPEPDPIDVDVTNAL